MKTEIRIIAFIKTTNLSSTLNAAKKVLDNQGFEFVFPETLRERIFNDEKAQPGEDYTCVSKNYKSIELGLRSTKYIGNLLPEEIGRSTLTVSIRAQNPPQDITLGKIIKLIELLAQTFTGVYISADFWEITDFKNTYYTIFTGDNKTMQVSYDKINAYLKKKVGNFPLIVYKSEALVKKEAGKPLEVDTSGWKVIAKGTGEEHHPGLRMEQYEQNGEHFVEIICGKWPDYSFGILVTGETAEKAISNLVKELENRGYEVIGKPKVKV